MPLWYVGALPDEDTSISNINYINSLAGQNLSDADVKQKIKDRFGLATYATLAWADNIINSPTTGQAFARRSELTSGFAGKIAVLGNDATGTPLKSRANGPVALDSTGGVHFSLLSGVSSTQTFPKMNWSPPSYSVINNVSAETNIAVVTVNPSLASYRVFVTGTVNATVTADGQYPQINVRAKTQSGEIVASGYGIAENYRGGVLQSFTGSGAYTYNIPSWADKIDVAVVGGGGGGDKGGLLAKGNGGRHGVWAAQTLTRGTNTLPSNLFTLTGTVGAGAPGTSGLFPGKDPGGTTSCVITGYGTINGAGGKSNDVNNGEGEATPDYTFNGIVFNGCPAVTTPGTAGNSPGGGGAGGPAGGGAGGQGGAGAAYFFAYTNDDKNFGQISVIPTPMNQQTVLTGPTTLYINVVRSVMSGVTASATVSTSSFNPQISVMVVPA